MNSEARRGAAIAAGAVLAFVALIAPQITGALNLTTLGKLLTIAGVGLLTAIAQRLNKCLRDRQLVKGALRAWPPEPLGAARIETLGVYPARGAGGEHIEYQARPSGEDDVLADALRTSKHVIVHGPPRCGTSRATVQAARRELGDVPAVIPLDAPSLRALLDDGMPPSNSQPQICLWLDGLDRFVESLDPPSVASLDAASGPAVRIVGTVRSKRWMELINGSGQPTEAARALAQGAQIVQLKSFSPATPGEPADEPATAHVEKPRAPWRDNILGLLLSGLLALILLGAIFNGNLLTPQSIGDQMDEIKSQILANAGPGGGHVVVEEQVWFHPADAPSWLLVTEDFPNHDEFYAGAANNARPRPRSDDLRIYDVINGRLRLELHFRPRGIGSKAAEWRVLEAGAAPVDYDEDGAPEMIAGYALPSQATEAILPFGIDWDDGRYRLVSLTPHKPQLGAYGLDARTRRYRQEAYERQLTLRTSVSEPRFSHLELKGYRVQAFALAKKPSLRLITGYFSAYPESGKTKMLEIHANQFRTGQLEILACTPSFYACSAPKAVEDAVIPPDKTPSDGLLEGWNMVGSRWNTPVRVLQRQSEPTPVATTYRHEAGRERACALPRGAACGSPSERRMRRSAELHMCSSEQGRMRPC